MRQTESLKLRLSVSEHLTSVGEEILCVLEQQLNGDVGEVVRVFVLERLSTAAGFVCTLFHRETKTLETLLERQDKLLDVLLQPRVILYRPGMVKEHFTTIQTFFISRYLQL